MPPMRMVLKSTVIPLERGARSHPVTENNFVIKCAAFVLVFIFVSRIVDHENVPWQWSTERLAW